MQAALRDELMNEVSRAGVYFRIAPLPSGRLASMVWLKGTKWLIASPRLLTSPGWLVRSVIYHELGHAAEGTCETRANRWAAERLIDPAGFEEAGRDCDWQPGAMAEVLGVSIRLVKAYAAKLKRETTLCLYIFGGTVLYGSVWASFSV